MQIILPNGQATLVDDEDAQRVDGYHWYQDGHGYVRADLAGEKFTLHRLIVGAAEGEIVDHINGEPLDNRRANLRICSHAENMRNRRMHKNNQCGAKGVYVDRGRKTPRYRAQIRVDGKKIILGSFKTIDEAATAYAEAAVKYHGEFASVPPRVAPSL